MNYVFCAAYASVFFALYLKNSGKEIKIITDNSGIDKYCRTAGIDCIYFDYLSVPTIRFYRMFALKNRINNLIKEIDVKEDDVFYLLDRAFDISQFYLAKEWARRGSVYFNLTGRVFDAYTESGYLNPRFLARTVSRYLFRIFLGLELVFVDVNHRPVWGIDDRFLKNNRISDYSLDKTFTELQLDAMRKSSVEMGEYDNLVISDGHLSGIIGEDSLIEVYGKLLRLPCEFVVKCHPRVLKNHELEGYERLFADCEQYPDYIPVELLLNNIRKNVISVFSTSLGSVAQLGHLKAISLLELVNWEHESYKKEIRTWLMKESNNRIIFVETFEELNKLLEA